MEKYPLNTSIKKIKNYTSIQPPSLILKTNQDTQFTKEKKPLFYCRPLCDCMVALVHWQRPKCGRVSIISSLASLTVRDSHTVSLLAWQCVHSAEHFHDKGRQRGQRFVLNVTEPSSNTYKNAAERVNYMI